MNDGDPIIGSSHEFNPDFCGGLSGDVHSEFGLSYASYLVWPRTLMQEMPPEWQHRFAQLAQEVSQRFTWPRDASVEVRLRDDRGRYVHDPLGKYRHPSRSAVEAARNE